MRGKIDGGMKDAINRRDAGVKLGLLHMGNQGCLDLGIQMECANLENG